MSLHCFFGVEMRADGTPVTPPMPQNSSLVLTHCALTSTTGGAVTLYVQSHDQPSRFAVCTLAADRNIYYAPLQLVFTQKASFTLVSSQGTAASGSGAAVHVTGYYESEEGYDAMDSDNEDEEDEEEGDAELTKQKVGRKHGRSENKQQLQKGTDKKQNKNNGGDGKAAKRK
ncbi:hypothetical protein DQ04_06321020 [Trypanosoma grayi]|uniref:hypothetical protein n=1 Tax=Trypanosoma grayi TaxID=71804 RepID=UPI0004F4A737|nr:hypothetical protein DQ04_06321020 [Trypanosoma grayi]KEG08847.1 hypothetical protein DQ04_06321020 [Trypanosoma grayi]